MCARIVTLLLILGGTTYGEAEVIVELVPDSPGPYTGGESLTVDVWLHSQLSFDLQVWEAQFDFSQTDGPLLAAATFTFDLTSSIRPGDFEVHDALPVPWAENSLEYGCDECRLQLPQLGSLHIGSIDVRVPTDPGVHRLDALNASIDVLGGKQGTFLRGGSFFLLAFTGEITGGTLDVSVVAGPIPAVSEWGLLIFATLILCVGSLVLRRRRGRGVGKSERGHGVSARSGPSLFLMCAMGAVVFTGGTADAVVAWTSSMFRSTQVRYLRPVAAAIPWSCTPKP